jgi:hypothetical protein
MIALAGVSAEFGVVMLVYIRQALAERGYVSLPASLEPTMTLIAGLSRVRTENRGAPWPELYPYSPHAFAVIKLSTGVAKPSQGRRG